MEDTVASARTVHQKVGEIGKGKEVASDGMMVQRKGRGRNGGQGEGEGSLE